MFGDHMYMWGHHMKVVPYKVWETTRYLFHIRYVVTIRVIDIISYMWQGHMYMWGDHTIPIPYKVWGTIRDI